jgi:hypothetical protein
VYEAAVESGDRQSFFSALEAAGVLGPGHAEMYRTLREAVRRHRAGEATTGIGSLVLAQVRMDRQTDRSTRIQRWPIPGAAAAAPPCACMQTDPLIGI